MSPRWRQFFRRPATVTIKTVRPVFLGLSPVNGWKKRETRNEKKRKAEKNSKEKEEKKTLRRRSVSERLFFLLFFSFSRSRTRLVCACFQTRSFAEWGRTIEIESTVRIFFYFFDNRRIGRTFFCGVCLLLYASIRRVPKYKKKEKKRKKKQKKKRDKLSTTNKTKYWIKSVSVRWAFTCKPLFPQWILKSRAALALAIKEVTKTAVLNPIREPRRLIRASSMPSNLWRRSERFVTNTHTHTLANKHSGGFFYVDAQRIAARPIERSRLSWTPPVWFFFSFFVSLSAFPRKVSFFFCCRCFYCNRR